MVCIGKSKSVTEFQSLSREMQSEIIITLKEEGASGRQLSRVSDLNRGIIMRMCKDGCAI